MRRTRFFVVLSGVSIGGAMLWTLGCTAAYRDCVDVSDPDSRRICKTFLPAGTGGGTPTGCIPSDSSKPVAETCGVFVSSSLGADGAAGTKSAPLKSLADAITKANGQPVYACAEAFAGSVTLASGSAIYGGLDCAKDWSYMGATTKSALMGDADKPALTLASAASGGKVEDFTITAANAMTAGSSSIAVVVDGATAELSRCDLIAGDAMAGAAGTHLMDDPTLNGDAGTNGAAACDAGAHSGPMGTTKMCSSGGMSIAGNGGDGGQVSMKMLQPATSGTDGSPADMSQPTDGKGGMGEGQAGALSCKDGTSGTSGAAGTSGAGASGTGSLTATAGYSGVNGSDGTPGKPGQGGGGGGGAKGGLQVTCGASTIDVPGASGGSGGTGGCGGAVGGGGNAGGSSIALVSMNARVTLTSVTLKAGKGGDGGKGGAGQSGGQKGKGGDSGNGGGAAQASCRGGDGGSGGLGGPGGGGQGGHSLGLAYTGTAPAIDPTQITPGTPGQGGPGGAGNMTPGMGKGADGVAMATQSFP